MKLLALLLLSLPAHAHLGSKVDGGCRALTGELADTAHAVAIRTGIGNDLKPAHLKDYTDVIERVFVQEGGWAMPPLPEPEDRTQTVTVVTIDGKPAACTRGDMLGAKFEIADLFPTELAHPLLKKFESQLGYISRVAVAPEWRGRRMTVAAVPHPISVAQAAMVENISALRDRGARVVYLAANPEAVTFYTRLGFRIIDEPKQCDGHPAIKMALVINDLAHFQAIDSPLKYLHPTPPTVTPDERAAIDLFSARR